MSAERLCSVCVCVCVRACQGHRFPVDARLSEMPPAGVKGKRMCVTVTSLLSPSARDAPPHSH